MTREEALDFFVRMIDQNSERARSFEPGFMQEKMKKSHDASKIAIDALQPWKKTADRPPTEADADEREKVLARDNIHGMTSMVMWKSVVDFPNVYALWLPIPRFQEVES